MYWITSSLFSIAQVATLRVGKVRQLLGIPARLDVTKTSAITAGVKKIDDKKKGFFQQAKECQCSIVVPTCYCIIVGFSWYNVPF